MCAIRKIGAFDLIICGRQAIDGDTAQVGPQTAEKLGVSQVTYVERILELDGRTIAIERGIEGGFETVRAKLPILLTVTSTANEPRPPRAKRLLQYRYHTCAPEIAGQVRKKLEVNGAAPADADVSAGMTPLLAEAQAKNRLIPVWDAAAVGAEEDKIGLRGSATKVKKIEFIVLKGRDLVKIEPNEEGCKALIRELVAEHIIG